MSAIQASRRGFLCSLATLSAGVVAGGASAIFDRPSAVNVEVLWKNLCKQHYSEVYNGQLAIKKEVEPCKGHEYKEGELVLFPRQQIVAQPIWIYWACNSEAPSDIIVNFYEKDVIIASMNQYELSVLANRTLADSLSVAINDKSSRIYMAKSLFSNQYKAQVI